MKKIYLNTLKTEEIIKRLKAGEIIKNDDDKRLELKCFDGILCSSDSNCRFINTHVLIDDTDDFYFEGADDSFKITETGLYKTRDGRRAFICQVKEHIVFGVIEGTSEWIRWSPDGMAYMEDVKDEKDYIVSRIDEGLDD